MRSITLVPFLVSLMLAGAFCPAQTAPQNSVKPVILPAIAAGPGIDRPDLPLKSLSAALRSHPHARVFQVEWDTFTFQTQQTLTARYDRKQGTLKLFYTEVWPDSQPDRQGWLYTHVTDTALDLASQNRPTGNYERLAFFDTLTQFGCKSKPLHFPSSARSKR